jgi:hypothetical protein
MVQGQQTALIKKGDLSTTFGFIHKVGTYNDGFALIGLLLDDVKK